MAFSCGTLLYLGTSTDGKVKSITEDGLPQGVDVLFRGLSRHTLEPFTHCSCSPVGIITLIGLVNYKLLFLAPCS